MADAQAVVADLASGDPIVVALDALTAALHTHAATVIGLRDDIGDWEAVMPLLSAASNYKECVERAGAWIPPLFNASPESDDDLEEVEDDSEDEDALVVPDGTERLRLVARWDFVVRDEPAFMDYARQRFTAAHPLATDIDTHVGTVGGAVEELFFQASDLYAEWTEHGIEYAGGSWDVRGIDRTYWESPEE
jgi:hypothetical protein